MEAAADEREFELKARLAASPDSLRALLEAEGWRPLFRGEMLDRRYDTSARRLEGEDVVLRLRRWRGREDASGEAAEERAVLAWKGPVAEVDGFKVRDEVEVAVGDAERAIRILNRLGFSEVTMAIDRQVELYRKGPVTVRIEEYPKMDVLVEIEGPPRVVEERLPELGLPREAWRASALPAFVEEFERRTGERAELAREGGGP